MIIADQPPSSCRLHQWNLKSAKQRGYRAQHEETHLPPCIGPSMVVCLRTRRLRGLSPKSNEDHITFLIFEDFFPHIFRTSLHQNHQYQYFSAENYNLQMGYGATTNFFLSFWFSPLCIFSLSKFLRKSVLKLRGSLQQSSVHLQCHAFNSYGHTSKVGGRDVL